MILMHDHPQQLTRDGKRKIRPVFTAGGQEIVYAVHESPNLVALMRLRVDDGSIQRVHPTIDAHQFDPAYSRDGRYHAFTMSQSSPQLVLVIEDTKEAKQFEYRPRESRATARCPTIAPDNSRVVFSVSDVGGHQIAQVDMAGKNFKRLTDSAGLNCWPAFSPDGSKIAFASSRSGDFDLYVMNADGSDVRRLTEGPGRDMRPAWSPDGRRIAFVRPRAGNYDVYTVGVDGTALSRVTDDRRRDDFPAWHPRGRGLLTVSQRAGRSDLYLFDVPQSA